MIFYVKIPHIVYLFINYNCQTIIYSIEIRLITSRHFEKCIMYFGVFYHLNCNVWTSIPTKKGCNPLDSWKKYQNSDDLLMLKLTDWNLCFLGIAKRNHTSDDEYIKNIIPFFTLFLRFIEFVTWVSKFESNRGSADNKRG